MAELFASGRVIDAILILILLELASLALWRAIGRRGPSVGQVLPYLLSGAALLLALRVALTDGAWTLIALFLLAAFVAHLYDLYRRWPGAD